MGYKKVPSIKHQCKGKYPMSDTNIYNAADRLDKAIYRVHKDSGKLVQVIGRYLQHYVGNTLNGGSVVVKRYEVRKLTDQEIVDFNKEGMVVCGIRIPLTIKQDSEL